MSLPNKIEIARVFRLSPEGNGIVRAFVDVNFNDCITVKGFKIVQLKDRPLSLVVPQEQAHDKKWYNTIRFHDFAVFQRLEQMAIEAYNEIGDKY